MPSEECFLCHSKITNKNNSKEHIIPNSIGGRKKIAGFICKECNNSRGSTWDSELARQLNPLSLFFKINRDGSVPSQVFETTSSRKLKLNADGSMVRQHPKYEEIPVESGVKINIEARH